MGFGWQTSFMATSAHAVRAQAQGEAVTVEPADPEMEPGAGLLASMEAEIDALYADRTGSIHVDSATSAAGMSPPAGAFLVVWSGDEAIGCGGLHRLDADTCEIKRMYLRPDWRGRGLSALLLEALEEQARALGYARTRLDTGDRQSAAKVLYDSTGYREIRDYNGNRLARHWFEREL
jgi:GNAT superfamily N-acetyltransferase